MLGSNGNPDWSNPNNWTNDSGTVRIPDAGDTVIFSGGLSFCHVDQAFTVAKLELTDTWANGMCHVDAPLTVLGDLTLDDPGGEFGGEGAMTIGGSGSSWSAGKLIIGAGGFTNNGALTINTGTITLTMSGTGTTPANDTLTNNGTMTEIGTGNLSLIPASTALLSVMNNGAYDFGGDCTIAGGINTQNDVLTNTSTGLVEKTGGTGTSRIGIDTFTNQAGGTLAVSSGTLRLQDASSCFLEGPTLEATARGTTLDLSGIVTGQGTFTGSGSGTILVDGRMVVPSQGVTLMMPGSSLFQWNGDRIDVSSGGTLTNATGSTLNISSPTGLRGAGTLVNKGVINDSDNIGLQLQNGATLANQKTYNLKSDAGIDVSGGGTLINTGTLHKMAGTGTSTISAPLNNTGTLLVSSGTVHVTGAVTQISGGVLNAGKWTVSVAGSRHGTLTIDSTFSTIGAHATVTLNGVNAAFTNLPGLVGIASGGSLVLNGTASLSTTGSFTNNGKLTVDAGSVLTVGGTFTQTSTATFTVQVKFSSTAPPLSGQVVVASGGGGASLGGMLVLTVSGTPNSSSQLTILDDLSTTAITGMFSNLAEGEKLTVGGHQYQIHYGSSAVTLTRVS